MHVIKIEGNSSDGLTKLVAKTCYQSGFNVQSFSIGTSGYIKFDKLPIVSRQEEFSDYLILEDRTADIRLAIRAAKEKSVILINAKEKPKLSEIKKRKLRLISIDAESVAQSTGKPVSKDAIMLGALVKFCDKLTSRAGKLALGEGKDSQMVFEEGFRLAK